MTWTAKTKPTNKNFEKVLESKVGDYSWTTETVNYKCNNNDINESSETNQSTMVSYMKKVKFQRSREKCFIQQIVVKYFLSKLVP